MWFSARLFLLLSVALSSLPAVAQVYTPQLGTYSGTFSFGAQQVYLSSAACKRVLNKLTKKSAPATVILRDSSLSLSVPAKPLLNLSSVKTSAYILPFKINGLGINSRSGFRNVKPFSSEFAKGSLRVSVNRGTPVLQEYLSQGGNLVDVDFIEVAVTYSQDTKKKGFCETSFGGVLYRKK